MECPIGNKRRLPYAFAEPPKKQGNLKTIIDESTSWKNEKFDELSSNSNISKNIPNEVEQTFSSDKKSEGCLRDTCVGNSDRNGQDKNIHYDEEEYPVNDQDDNKEAHEEDQQDDILQTSFRYYRSGEANCLNGKINDLRVFQVLDECVASDDDDDSSDDSASEISYGKIDAMLEEGLKNTASEGKTVFENNVSEANGVRYTKHNTLILEELGHNHFDILPEGWTQVTHKSGMPVYVHKGSRVCTFSRPYYLGQESVRKHNVPLNTVPCLQYRRALEEEEKKKELEQNTSTTNNGPYLDTAKIETTEGNKLSQFVNAFTIQQYCKKLFRFKKEQKLHFLSWADRKKYAKAKKIEKEHHLPSFPEGTKLIKCPIKNTEDGPRAKPSGEWIMNPNGKSFVRVLHEYVQHALKRVPTYEFKSIENPLNPYSATAIINDMRYGYGTGTSKKQAKQAAAKASLEILVPEMREKIRSDNRNGKSGGTTNFPEEEETSISIFDEIRIEDPRLAEFSSKSAQPSPYSILLRCLQRNFGLKDMPIDCKVNPLNCHSNEFIMTVGKHTARVVCKNKKEGKQRASQSILQDLHPHVSSWGALLRLYCDRALRNEKHINQEVKMLESRDRLNPPNYSIINKLQREMKKLHQKILTVQPTGVFIPPDGVALPSSGTELDKVDC